MIRTSSKKALMVAPDVYPNQLLADYGTVKHISEINSLFPSLYQLNPDAIILDCDYIGKDVEKILRRIKSNKFYHKLKISCYKNELNEKYDSLLKVLGADSIIYREDLAKPQKGKSLLNAVNTIIDASVMKLMGSTSQ